MKHVLYTFDHVYSSIIIIIIRDIILYYKIKAIHIFAEERQHLLSVFYAMRKLSDISVQFVPHNSLCLSLSLEKFEIIEL